MTESDDPNVLRKSLADPFRAVTEDPFGLQLFGLQTGTLADNADAGAVAQPEEEERSKTAAPTERISEQARRNRRRSSSILTRGFALPTLSTAGRLG